MQNVLNYFPNVLQRGIIEPYMQKGEWATHQVLPSLLDLFPQSEIYLSSFNISDQSLRSLAVLQKQGKFERLSLLLDRSLLKNKVALLRFAYNITQNVRLNSIHAKIILIQNKNRCFGIVGSQNFNQNKKIEAGFYFTDDKIFQFYKEKFLFFYNQSLQYEFK